MAAERDFSNLLIAEAPVAFLPSLAVIYGEKEALLLQQVHYWSISPFDNRISIMQHQGRTWVRIPPKAFLDVAHGPLRFMAPRTLDRTIASAREQGALLSDQLSLDDGDPTNWYAIDYAALGKKVDTYKCTLEVDPKIKKATSKRREASRQNGERPTAKVTEGHPSTRRQPPVPSRRNDHAKAAESYKDESTNKKQQQETPVVVDDLTNQLTAAGVTASTAAQLSSDAPDESRRQLGYLPYRTGRTNRAATLVKAIREAWAAPPEWEAAQEALLADKRAGEVVARREAERQQEAAQRRETEAANAAVDAMFAELPERHRAAIDAEATERLGLLGALGKSAAGLAAMRRELVRARLGELVAGGEPEPEAVPVVVKRPKKKPGPEQGGLFG